MNMQLVNGSLDWRGNLIDPQRHGGLKSALLLYVLILVRSSVNSSNINLVGYLRGTLHMNIASCSIVITNFVGATWIFTFIGAFVSDSFMKRFTAILIFGPLEILGYGLLALQAYHPSLHPARCDMNRVHPEPDCPGRHGRHIAWLYISIFLIALGEGFMRACTPLLMGDQFDSNDQVESRRKIWSFYLIPVVSSCGSALGLILLVWIENFRNWILGFGTSSIFVLGGLLVVASGFSIYRMREPEGTPFKRILQVLVAALKKRKLVTPQNLEDPPDISSSNKDSCDIEAIPCPKELMFLDKASSYNGDTSPWTYCTISQVEDAKSFLKLIPIIMSSILCCIPFFLVLTFTVQVGATMNKKIGSVYMSSASLFVIPIFIQLIILIIYRHRIQPLIKKQVNKIHLLRVGTGFVFAMLAVCAAAFTERRRTTVLLENNELLSLFCLLPQFVLISIMEVTSFIGLTDFFRAELSEKIKHIATSIVFFILGLAALLGGLIIQVINEVTRLNGHKRNGWLDGEDFNKTRLDLFYWFLLIVEFLSLLNFVYWARRYLQINAS